jgi:hypothetical protein
MKATLTFDLDDVEDIDTFNAFALRVATEYSNVWIRKSSSGNGFHLKIAGETEYDELTGRMVMADRLFEAEKVLSLRENESEECRGRLTGDKGRFKVGLQVGRLFGVKTGKEAGKWIPIEAYFKNEKVLEG